MDLSTTILSSSLPHTHTVVFLHGRGDTAQNFSSSLRFSRDSHGRSIFENFPSFRWVFPQAELRQTAALEGQKTSQWFDVWNVSDFSDHEELQATGLRESVASIRRILVNEAAILEGKWDHVILAGISQGAATSVHTLLNLNVPQRLGAFLGFSCRMPFPGRSLADTRAVLGLEDIAHSDVVLKNTPVLLEHCVDDPLVPVEWGQVLRDTLGGFGAQVTWKEYRDGGHWFNSPVGIHDAVEFLKSHVLRSASAGESLLAQVNSSSMDLS
jgi:predicted esterase